MVGGAQTKGPYTRNLCLQDRPVMAKNKNVLVLDDSVTSHVDDMSPIERDNRNFILPKKLINHEAGGSCCLLFVMLVISRTFIMVVGVVVVLVVMVLTMTTASIVVIMPAAADTN